MKGFVQILRQEKTSKVVHRRKSGYLGRNQLSWDLGINPDQYDLPVDSDGIRERIEKLDDEFELVKLNFRFILKKILINLRF